MLKKSREVTRLFKVVRSRIDEMNGGIGNLRTGYDELTSRINKTEYQRSKRIQDNGDRIVNFLNNAQKTDRAVAGKITIDNIRFGMKNPWAVEKSLKEKVFSGLSAIGDWFTDWSGTVRFMKKACSCYQENPYRCRRCRSNSRSNRNHSIKRRNSCSASCCGIEGCCRLRTCRRCYKRGGERIC